MFELPPPRKLGWWNFIQRCGVFWKKKKDPRHHPRAHAGTWVRNPRLLLQIAWPASHGWKWCGSSLRQRWKYGDKRWSAHPTYVGKTLKKKQQPHLQHLFDLPKNDQRCSDGAAYGWGKKVNIPGIHEMKSTPHLAMRRRAKRRKKGMPKIHTSPSCVFMSISLLDIGDNQQQHTSEPRTKNMSCIFVHWRTRSTLLKSCPIWDTLFTLLFASWEPATGEIWPALEYYLSHSTNTVPSSGLTPFPIFKVPCCLATIKAGMQESTLPWLQFIKTGLVDGWSFWWNVGHQHFSGTIIHIPTTCTCGNKTKKDDPCGSWSWNSQKML